MESSDQKVENRAQRFKYLVCQPTVDKGQNQWEAYQFPDYNTEGNMLAASSRFVAFPWKGGGGTVAITPADK